MRYQLQLVISPVNLDDVTQCLKMSVAGALITVGNMLTFGRAKSNLRGVPESDRPTVWQMAVIGALAGATFYATGPLRKRGRLGYYASWTLSLMVGLAVFMVPALLSLLNRPKLVAANIALWLGLSIMAGLVAGRFFEVLRRRHESQD